MPTYGFQCMTCRRELEHFMSIGDYSRNPPAFFCCQQRMERRLSVVPALAVSNALANDRHYEGLRASDGTDISSRAKHRAYMKANNLTTVDDFAQTWKRDARERTERLAGQDAQRAQDVANAITQLGG